MAKQLWLNNLDTELIGVVKALPDTGSPATELGYGIIQLTGAMGTVLPALTGGNWFLLTLFKVVGGLEDDIEIVKVTSIDTSSGSETRLTVERGYEGTTIRAFAIGDKVSMRMTAGSADNFTQKSMNLGDLPDPGVALDNLGGEPEIAAPGSAPTEKYWRGDKSWRDFFTDVRAATLTGLSTATNAVITAADTVLGALGKLQKQISDHLADTSGAHSASAIDLVSDPTPIGSGSLTAGTVQQRMEEIFENHAGTADTLAIHVSLGGHAAANITNTPTGGIAATDVQSAINELDTEKFAKTGGLINATSATSPTSRGVTTVFANFGNGASGSSVAAVALGSAQGQMAGYSFFATFTGTGDNQPRRTADIWASYSGIWGTEKLSFGVGRDGAANDSVLATVEKLVISSGNGASTALFVNNTAFGYGAGSGGTVTQPTSKSSAVTLNKPSGQITMNAASLAAGAAAEFQLNNSFITNSSVVVPNAVAFPSYTVLSKYVDTGLCVLRVVNVSAGALAEPVVINFAVERVSTS